MNPFHIEQRIETYNSKLLLIPKISGNLLTTTILEKQNQFFKNLMNKII